MSTPKENIGRLLKSVTGWDTLDLDRRGDGQAIGEGFRIARLFSDTFDTVVGQALLEHMIVTFLCRPIVRPADTQFEAGIRQGQADVVMQILSNIEIARRGPPK